jgi:TonB family protein
VIGLENPAACFILDALGTVPTITRHRRPRTGLAIAAALVVHVVIFGPFDGLGLFALGNAPAHPHHAAAILADAPELVTTCTGDAGLASAARYALCGAPWVDDVDQCLDEAFTNMWMDLSSCSAGADPGIAVAILEPKAIEKLAAIDPEKLLDESLPPPPPEALQPPPPPPPQVAPPPPPPPPQQPQQVVETAKPNHEEEPVNARLLAEYNTKVEKEKVARGATKEPMVAKSKPEELAVKDKPKDETPATEKPAEDRKPGKDSHAPDAPGMLSMRNPGMPALPNDQQDPRTKGTPAGARGPSIADGFMPKQGTGAIEQDRHERQEIPRGNGGAGGGAPPNLKPSKEMLERIAGGGNVDHLDDVDNGDETALTAKRWVYASFFNRLKRQVAQNWAPGGVWRNADPTGQVYGFKSRITEVRASLSPGGAIANLIVIAPSGVGALDDEAMRAFRAAGPFPNPPEGLVGKDGMITFAFSFYFEIGATHSSWRVVKSS